MSNDIRDIIRRLDMVEGRLSPAQQKVPQLPALFKPHHIRALGSKTDPAHPMDGYMVGDSVQPRRTALEEAMAEIEEDMLSKVKRDLTHYLDRLEKKVSINRDLKDKAKDAVQKRQPEEEIEEFAPVGGDDREPDEEEILRQLAAQWWNGTEQQMAKAQRTLAAMGWEIGPDESGDDDAGVYVYRIGDEDGRDTIPFAHSDLDILDEVDFSGSAPTQAQIDQFNAVNAAAGSAAGQMEKGGKPLDLAKSLYNVADATGSKASSAWTGAKALGSAVGAKLTGNDPAAAAANSVANSFLSPLSGVDYKKVVGDLQQYRGKDLTQDPQFAKLPKEKQQQVIAAQKQVQGMSDDDLAAVGNLDLKQTQADLAGVLQPSKVNPKTDAGLASPETYAALGIERPDPASVKAGQNKSPAPAPAPPAPAPTTPTPAPKATTTTPAAPTTPAATFEMADGKSLGCYGDDDQGYELRHGQQALPSRFRSLDDAGMAVKLYQARRQAQQRNSNTDYIEER